METLLHNTSRFLEMELWRLKVHVRRGIFFTTHGKGAFFIFDRLYFMIDVSFGERERCNFSQFC